MPGTVNIYTNNLFESRNSLWSAGCYHLSLTDTETEGEF